MAYETAGNVLSQISSVNGFGLYRFDTTDTPVSVEAAGYFNNVDDNLNLGRGDMIFVYTWTTVRTGTLSRVGAVAVTNVIANDAASSAGAVNVAEILVSTAGAISSLA